MSKKIYFYKVSLFTVAKVEIEYHKIKDIFKKIIEENSKDNGDYRSLDLTLEEDAMHIIWDIFEYKDAKLFGRLSKQKPSNSFIQREYTNFQKDDLLPGNDERAQGIEKYTYANLDYETGIFSIVSAQGAPGETAISRALLMYAPQYVLELQPIPNRDAINAIYNGQDAEITGLSIEIPLPDAGTLKNVLGWQDDEIINTISNRGLTVWFELKPPKRRHITANSQETMTFIDCLKQSLGKYRKGKLKAKTKEVQLREYNLFDENFSHPINIPIYHIENGEKEYYSVDELTEKYKKAMIQAFQQNKRLLQNIICRE